MMSGCVWTSRYLPRRKMWETYIEETWRYYGGSDGPIGREYALFDSRLCFVNRPDAGGSGLKPFGDSKVFRRSSPGAFSEAERMPMSGALFTSRGSYPRDDASGEMRRLGNARFGPIISPPPLPLLPFLFLTRPPPLVPLSHSQCPRSRPFQKREPLCGHL